MIEAKKLEKEFLEETRNTCEDLEFLLQHIPEAKIDLDFTTNSINNLIDLISAFETLSEGLKETFEYHVAKYVGQTIIVQTKAEWKIERKKSSVHYMQMKVTNFGEYDWESIFLSDIRRNITDKKWIAGKIVEAKKISLEFNKILKIYQANPSLTTEEILRLFFGAEEHKKLKWNKRKVKYYSEKLVSIRDRNNKKIKVNAPQY